MRRKVRFAIAAPGTDEGKTMRTARTLGLACSVVLGSAACSGDLAEASGELALELSDMPDDVKEVEYVVRGKDFEPIFESKKKDDHGKKDDHDKNDDGKRADVRGDHDKKDHDGKNEKEPHVKVPVSEDIEVKVQAYTKDRWCEGWSRADVHPGKTTKVKTKMYCYRDDEKKRPKKLADVVREEKAKKGKKDDTKHDGKGKDGKDREADVRDEGKKDDHHAKDGKDGKDGKDREEDLRGDEKKPGIKVDRPHKQPHCPKIVSAAAIPAHVEIGDRALVKVFADAHDEARFRWEGEKKDANFEDRNTWRTGFICTEEGEHSIWATVTDPSGCSERIEVRVACVIPDGKKGDDHGKKHDDKKHDDNNEKDHDRKDDHRKDGDPDYVIL